MLDVVPLERLWQVLVSVIYIAILVQVFVIVVSPRGIATLRVGLGVALLLKQIIEILLVLRRPNDGALYQVQHRLDNSALAVDCGLRHPKEALDLGVELRLCRQLRIGVFAAPRDWQVLSIGPLVTRYSCDTPCPWCLAPPSTQALMCSL